ncbi:MAG: aminodeoxychorismate/anthranilate synthase component II [Chthoniobacterales bacterium]|nr:aminodeoxychorismate/anthranilate synthase component II [Chthoniobacterales bacterium]
MLVIDNYDSFTYNLVHYFGELGAQPVVYHHDQISIEEIQRLAPKWLCISPGPGTPSEAGISKEVIRAFAGKIPILGVCLGHQCIAEVFGGKIVRATQLLHGKTSLIHHNGQDLFHGLPNPFSATRYHSLLVERSSFPECLEITAQTAEEEMMGLRHRTLPVWGVQFHPESILTTHGKELLKNFLQFS